MTETAGARPGRWGRWTSSVADRRWRRLVLALALTATIVALFAVNHRARKGQGALLRWDWALEALDAGLPLYGEASAPHRPTVEGYPTLPVTLLLLRPFHALGPRVGPVAWAALCAVLAWCVVLVALCLAPRGPAPIDGVGQLTVLVLAGRVLYSELQHGNLNLVVGALAAFAIASWARGHELLAGFLFGAGAVVKATPALALVWIARARSGAGLAGFVLGVMTFAFLLPGVAFGFARNLELVSEWWGQMVAPYVAGRQLGAFQTEHLNQSLLGVLARYLTDSVAIAARPPEFPEPFVIGWLHLAPATLHGLHRVLALALVALVWRSAPGPRSDRRGCEGAPRDARALLGAASVLILAMLFLSERSWKHHYVLLPLPLAYLTWSARVQRSRVARCGLAAACAAFVLTGEGLLGARGADLAEAYGAYFLGGVALLIACDRVQASERS